MSLPAPKKDDEARPPARPGPGRGRMERVMDRIKGSALHVDEELFDTLCAAQEGLWTVVVRPPENSGKHPLETAEQLLADIHGQVGWCSFEIHQQQDGVIEFHVVTETEQLAEWLLTYVNSSTEARATEITQASLPVTPGQAASVAQLEYTRDFLLPLHNARSDGATSDDPFRSLLDLMAESWGDHGVIQTVVEPVNQSWTTRLARGPVLGHRWDRRADVAGAALLSAAVIGGWLWINHWQIAALFPPATYWLVGVCAIFWLFAVLGAGLLPWV
ncbi:hypothetical protein, partial [Halocatena marina]|uniref:hypothetical protein n=1 Tax=Halocatena marina TaxID=2934937 RepID=UPI00200D3E5E